MLRRMALAFHLHSILCHRRRWQLRMRQRRIQRGIGTATRTPSNASHDTSSRAVWSVMRARSEWREDELKLMLRCKAKSSMK